MCKIHCKGKDCHSNQYRNPNNIFCMFLDNHNNLYLLFLCLLDILQHMFHYIKALTPHLFLPLKYACMINKYLEKCTSYMAANIISTKNHLNIALKGNHLRTNNLHYHYCMLIHCKLRHNYRFKEMLMYILMRNHLLLQFLCIAKYY